MSEIGEKRPLTGIPDASSNTPTSRATGAHCLAFLRLLPPTGEVLCLPLPLLLTLVSRKVVIYGHSTLWAQPSWLSTAEVDLSVKI